MKTFFRLSLNKVLLVLLCSMPCVDALSMDAMHPKLSLGTGATSGLHGVNAVHLVKPVAIKGHGSLMRRIFWGLGISAVAGIAVYCGWKFWLKSYLQKRRTKVRYLPSRSMEESKRQFLKIKKEIEDKLMVPSVPGAIVPGDCPICLTETDGILSCKHNVCAGCLIDSLKGAFTEAHLMVDGKAAKIPEALYTMCDVHLLERVKKALSTICDAESVLRMVFDYQDTSAYTIEQANQFKREKDEASQWLGDLIDRALNDPKAIEEKIFVLTAPLVNCSMCRHTEALKDVLGLPGNRKVLKDLRTKLLTIA
ncbi:TPA: hypothetical protein DDZ86_00045 [Candidatus Dependentiae bacterium]|nr:MAG: hypothetical protein UW09_C0002G0109 [candidate division TM6 bacterium GW2011_GWF2_43_87]HBL98018.1 hypothetical protein [Candidatus Dependentiae bacterium]